MNIFLSNIFYINAVDRVSTITTGVAKRVLLWPRSSCLLHYLLLLTVLALFFPTISLAEDNYEKTISTIEQRHNVIKKGNYQEEQDISALKSAAIDIGDVKSKITGYLATLELELNKTQQGLKTLGEAIKGEPSEVATKRKELEKEKNSIENNKSRLRLLSLQSDEILQAITHRQKELLATHLFAESPDVAELFEQNWKEKEAVIKSFSKFLANQSGLNLLTGNYYIIFVFIIFTTLIIGTGIRHKLIKLGESHICTEQFSSQFTHAGIVSFARFAPHILLAAGMACIFYIITKNIVPRPFLSYVAYGLPVYFLFATAIKLFFSPTKTGKTVLNIPAEISILLSRRLHVLLILAYIGYLFFSAIIEQNLPETAFLLARSSFALLLIVNLVWLIWLLRRLPGLAIVGWLPFVITLVLSASLISEMMGYRNLSSSIFRSTVGIITAFGLLMLINQIFSDVFDGIDKGRSVWQRRFKASLGYKLEEPVPGIIWARLTITISLWSIFAWSVLHILGLSEQALQQIYAYIIDGFNIGTLHIGPARVLLSLLVFAVLYLVSGWLRARLDERWLKKSRIERGAREAMVTIAWYVGIAIAFLVAISIAGVTFTNLAIIAGALSVGIGFGLQNIVNNFVSGIILLFERPIKRGDWIVVGNTEGYVKNIRIRSTQIQTFDRADVIVPNSDLISSQLTNWMLYDNAGRIRLPVGVAYGSDTEKVKHVLEEVGASHDEVITNNKDLKLTVLFLAFGESSLDFELRCHIRNIDKRFQVTSDLNFAIDKAFRENEIEISFPQRDLHIRDLPAGRSNLLPDDDKST